MWRILYSALIHTKNLFTCIIGDKFFSNFFNNKSELGTNNWDLTKRLKLISDIFWIRLPFHCPSWVPYPIKLILFGDNSNYIISKNEIVDKICMIFLNGILYNDTLNEMTQTQLESIFNRPINILKNASDSLFSDLIEACIGKSTNELNEASLVALHTLCNKLVNPEIDKVILICHSQGSIIMSNVLENLKKLGLDKKVYLDKLEIYSFATCASKMNYVMDQLPYMEHFANDNDIVANLGCNHNKDIDDLISIDGTIFIKEDKSGHMFNTHYIDNFVNDFPSSKLLSYVKTD
jgi:hypothetical protein